jgi:hypothetical protein
MFGLLVWYWIELNIFQVSLALLAIAPLAVFTGTRTLRIIAERKTKWKSE